MCSNKNLKSFENYDKRYTFGNQINKLLVRSQQLIIIRFLLNDQIYP